ncbi:MAG: sigma-70 family RNA polymerase sigma factor [Planctomycetota bacterium]
MQTLLAERLHLRRFARSLARGDEHLADDLEQATLLAALKTKARPVESPGRWLFTTCRNALRDASRSAVPTLEDSARDASSSEAGPSEHLLDREVQREVRRALSTLQPIHAQAVELRYLEGLAPDGVAERLRVPRETARSRIKRGLSMLREELERSGVAG